MKQFILQVWLLVGLITIIIIGGQIMSNNTLTPEAKEFMKNMTTTKKTGSSWRSEFKKFIIAHPTCTVDELVKATRPDLVKVLTEDRKKVLKNVSSQLTYLRKDLVDVSMNEGVIQLHAYFDLTTNKVVKPKAKTKKAVSK